MSVQPPTPTLLRRADRVLWRATPGGVVLLSMTMPEPVLLAGSGAALWELFAEPIRLDEAAIALADAYGISSDVALPAIEPVARELVRGGAVVELLP